MGVFFGSNRPLTFGFSVPIASQLFSFSCIRVDSELILLEYDQDVIPCSQSVQIQTCVR